ncbi:MAG: hypothetical protein Q8M03_03495 [Legionella sp.]|nr:hypothetical protein [Legionella sp.]
MSNSTQNILNGLCAKTHTSEKAGENFSGELTNDAPVKTLQNSLDFSLELQDCLTNKDKNELKL